MAGTLRVPNGGGGETYSPRLEVWGSLGREGERSISGRETACAQALGGGKILKFQKGEAGRCQAIQGSVGQGREFAFVLRVAAIVSDAGAVRPALSRPQQRGRGSA